MGAALVECDIFLILSDLPSVLNMICVFVPLQQCSYDVLCASIDVQPVHGEVLIL